MRSLLVVGLLALSRIAIACPACASGQRATPSAIYFVLMVLPFIAAGFATRAIVRVLREGPLD